MADRTYNTMADSAPGVDFEAVPIKGINRILSQFTLLETDQNAWQNTMDNTNIITNTLEG